jgi:hypothetical protein
MSNNMITIQGLSPLQREIADRIWAMDSQLEVEHYIQSMPRRMRRQAWTVLMMIIAAELDNYMEVSDEVRDYLGAR